MIDNKPFSNQQVKTKQEVYEKFIEISINYDYITKNLLNYLYHQKYCKLIGIDLSRQGNMSIPQQINFTGTLEEDDGAAMIFIAEKQQKVILNISLDWLIDCIRIIQTINYQKNTKFIEWNKWF